MIRIYTDFNAMTAQDECWLLLVDGKPFGDQVSTLELRVGDAVVLYQDEDDFDVTATLDYGRVDMLGRDAWIARPDWSTLVRKQP